MANWDCSVDFVIVGSGGGLVAALAADEAGADVLVLEKRALIGGSTAMSGGVVWVPDNPLMRADGVPDSYADGMAYFDAVVGDVGPASSFERRHAYLTRGPEMISYLQDQGIEFVRCPGYSDYYSGRKGGSEAGRSIEPVPYDAHQLREWRAKLQYGIGAELGYAVKTNEVRTMIHFNRSLPSFLTTMKIVIRTYLARIRRQDLVTSGTALTARLLKIGIDRKIPIWTEAPAEDLIVEDGRVVGVRTVKDGVQKLVEARKGVLLAAGGFSHNAEMRRTYSGEQPNEGQWTMANPGDTGEVLQAAMRLGAKIDLMDEAWWFPGPTGVLAETSLAFARQRPGTIFVDEAGQRFVNESNSYVEVGKAMYARNQQSRAVPCWLIFDDGYRRRYSHTKSIRTGHLAPEWFETGLLKKATTIEDLARQCGIDPGGLAATVERFNRNAVKGIDPDFGRGETAYNRTMGDPGFKPNPCLGPLVDAPFYATQIVPADVGTCGGLLTDERARVLDQQGQPISGLYATGNTTATVMGRHYLGAGASIGNSMVFGYIAAQHACGSVSTAQ